MNALTLAGKDARLQGVNMIANTTTSAETAAKFRVGDERLIKVTESAAKRWVRC